MATLHVRNVPDSLYEALRGCAEQSGRSIGAQAIRLLEQALAGQVAQRPRWLARRRRSGGRFQRFTQRARSAVVAAQDEARALGHDHVGSGHLLLGLLAVGEGPGAKALETLGVTAERARAEVAERTAPAEGPPPGAIPFGPDAKKALELALRESLALRHEYIGTEHLLLGIVAAGEGAGAEGVRVAEPDAAAVRDVAPTARVEIVPNGVVAGPEPTPPPSAPVLGFHGSFDAAHNVDAARVLVEDVLPRVRMTVPDARVLLVGRRPGDVVRRLCGPHVELRADVADARAELSDVAVYVAPLVSGSGLKNKVLEAMAAGRPVVTTSLGAAGIGAGDGVVVTDVGGIAAHVVALLTDREQLGREGVAGRRRVTHEFTWERSAQRIESLWQDVT